MEQATYHEWLNSAFADDGDTPKDCQDCHMPLVDGGVIIVWASVSGVHVRLIESTSWWGNAQMLEIMRDNTELLGLAASAHLTARWPGRGIAAPRNRRPSGPPG